MGTHCWFCDRQFGVDKQIYSRSGTPLVRTREHIIPKSRIIYSYRRNYIASCHDCNSLKGRMDAKQFAVHIEKLMKLESHNMSKLLPLMRVRAWKLYNKTSYLHKNYRNLTLGGKK